MDSYHGDHKHTHTVSCGQSLLKTKTSGQPHSDPRFFSVRQQTSNIKTRKCSCPFGHVHKTTLTTTFINILFMFKGVVPLVLVRLDISERKHFYKPRL